MPLDHAYELDDAPAFERFFFVTEATPDGASVDVDRVLSAANRLAAADGRLGSGDPRIQQDGVAGTAKNDRRDVATRAGCRDCDTPPGAAAHDPPARGGSTSSGRVEIWSVSANVPMLTWCTTLLLAACGGGPSSSSGIRPTLRFETCPLEIATGPLRDARCTHVTVYEDRDLQKGRTLDLNVVVVPARDRTPHPDPLVLLAGGPGQAATDLGAMLLATLEMVHRTRDIVLVDQRGTGASHPLDCEPARASTVTDRLRVDFNPADLTACLARYDADPRLYTTPLAMDDLEQVRAALGYETINLWGGSYGSRAALVYMRRHPQRVRSVVLDGVAPPDMALLNSAARDASRALSLVFDDCEADETCATAFPDIRDRATRLVDRLSHQPAEVRIAHPRTGVVERVTIRRETFTSVLRSALYRPELSALIPLLVHRAEEADFSPIAAIADAFADMGHGLSVGMHLSVLCSEDLGRASPDGRVLTDAFFRPATFLEPLQAACAQWPHRPMAVTYYDPIVSSAPTLLFSGELDPVTPPRWAERAADHLSRAKVITLPGVGHGTVTRTCVSRIIADFLDDPEPDQVDASCAFGIERPPFFVGSTGPVPDTAAISDPSNAENEP